MLSERDLLDLVDDLESNQISKDANLTVYLGGLAIGHMGTKSWRSVFLDGVPDHDLQLTVLRKRGSSYEDVSTWKDVAMACPLKIVPRGVDYWTSRYQNSHDPNPARFDHLVNFTTLHGEQPKFTNPEGIALRGVEVFGGEGFTAKLSNDGRAKYWFQRRGQEPTKEQVLGTWLGINHRVEGGRSVELSGWRGKIHSSICNESSKVIVLVTNNCLSDHGCTESMDFSYYYYESGKDQKGVIAGDPFTLHTNEKSDRIACNKMMIDDLGGLSSLFDLEG